MRIYPNKSSSSQNRAGMPPKRSPKLKNSARRISVDIVTGREVTSVYFNPNAIVDNNTVFSEEWIGANLFIPAIIVKQDDSTGIISVRLPNREVFKIQQHLSVIVNPHDDEGVEDILRLIEISEMSLLHTLRLRYLRDDIYTFAGPILISINPYKWSKDLYADHLIMQYHKQKQVALLIDFSFFHKFLNFIYID